jgi:dTMP kinase
MSGTLIAAEGDDLAGKSTCMKRLADTFGSLLVHEPGFTPFGAKLRHIAKNVPADANSLALLMAADRCETFRTVTSPALGAGDIVFSDRSLYSSFAYQGSHGVSFEALRMINEFALDDRYPDLVLYFDVSPATAALRAISRAREDGVEVDIIEDGRKGTLREFFDSARRESEEANRSKWVTIDANGTPDEVYAEAFEVVQGFVRQRL